MTKNNIARVRSSSKSVEEIIPSMPLGPLGGISLSIPETESANLKLPNPDLLNYYQGRESRILWIDCDIDVGVLEIAKTIIQYNREDEKIPVEDRKPIKILLYTYGGDGQACFSLLDVIKLSKTPVYTVNMGLAMSAGLLILLAGHKRFCLKHSLSLAHSGSGGTQGTYESTKAQMEDYEHFVEEMRSYILENTTIDKKLMSKKKNQEWYLYAEDQLRYHIVDKIIDNLEDIL